jgi:hypothetical protein
VTSAQATRLLHALIIATVGAGGVAACSDNPDPTDDKRNPGTSIASSEPSPGITLHQEVVTLTRGHCWIEPITFDARRWAALSADQDDRLELIEGHESEGTMTLLAPQRARWTSEVWGVIRFRPYGSPRTWPSKHAGCL